MIDTPGFDDSTRKDVEVLKDISFFLSKTYRQGIKLTGIVYLHKITDNRMSGSSILNLNMFKKLCGEHIYPHIVLATTMWGILRGSEENVQKGEDAMKELVARPDWWGLMYDRGSKIVKHDGDRESALSIVRSLVTSRDRDMVLTIQHELVVEKVTLENTGAGRQLESHIREACAKLEDKIKDLDESYRVALEERDAQLADMLKTQMAAHELKIDQASQDYQDLRINFDRLSEEKETQYQQLLQRLLKEERNNELLQKRTEAERLQAQRQHDAQQEELKRRYDSLLEKSNTRSESDKQQLDSQLQELQARYQQLEQDWQAKDEALQTKIANARRKRKRDSLLPVLQVLLGVGQIAGGIVLFSPDMISSGMSTVAGAGAGTGESEATGPEA